MESFALSDSAISESLRETPSTQELDAEARQKEVAAWIAAFRARSEGDASASVPAAAASASSKAEEPNTVSTPDNVKSLNPFAAFFSWLRSLWTAIISMFKQDSGSKPQTA